MMKIATALRESLQEGYSFNKFIQDLQAGATVGIVAIPLAMALSIASGVAPQNGLYTVVIAGAIVALLGGSKHQVTGPTAAFVVLLVPVVTQFGLAGLLTAGLLAGIILIIFGVMGIGKIIQIVPHPVTTGFTSGIAVVIAAIQLKDFLGLRFAEAPENFFDRLRLLALHLPEVRWPELAVGVVTLLIIVICVRFFKRLPGPIIAIGLVTLITASMQKLNPGFSVATILSEFKYGVDGVGIPAGGPHWTWPWQQPGAEGMPFVLNWEMLTALLPSSFAIALLGAIESLLSAVVADGLTRQRHDSDAELIALGISNVICPFFGGIAATGAVARTTTNIRFGAQTPAAAFIHAVVVLIVLLFFAKFISLVPLSALAALLLFVAYNMFDRRHFVNVLKMGNNDDRLVLLVCFSLTVLFDMVIGVGVGVVLASILIVKRFAGLTQGLTLSEFRDQDALHTLPKGVLYYQIRGPLFFGASHKAIHTIEKVSHDVKTIILDLNNVNLIDMTGLVALDSILRVLADSHRRALIICSERGIRDAIGQLEVVRTDTQSIQLFKSEREAFTAALANQQ